MAELEAENNHRVPLACYTSVPERGNALPLIHELRHALEHLLRTGEETTIDLNSLPLGPADETSLEALLGRGEIEATLQALGTSTIRETAFPGIWQITHYDQNQTTSARFLSVCWIPEILRAQPADVEGSARRLIELADEKSNQAQSEVKS